MKRLMLVVLFTLSLACRTSSACEDTVQVVAEYLDGRLLLMLHSIEVAYCTNDELEARPCNTDSNCWDGRGQMIDEDESYSRVLPAVMKELPTRNIDENEEFTRSVNNIHRRKLAHLLSSGFRSILLRDIGLFMKVARSCLPSSRFPHPKLWSKLDNFGIEVFEINLGRKPTDPPPDGCKRIQTLIDIHRANPLYTTLIATEAPADEADPDSSSLVTQ
jgi:hypothetical protein